MTVIVCLFCPAASTHVSNQSASSQTLVKQNIIGLWEGTVVMHIDEERMATRVRFEFGSDGVLTLSMDHEERAQYRLAGDRIDVLFNDGSNEPFVLDNVVVSDRGLSADLHFVSDPPTLKTSVRLAKMEREQLGTTNGSSGGCSNLPPEIESIFAKYQFTCPIRIWENMNWYNIDPFSHFLSEVVAASVKHETPFSPVTAPYAFVAEGKINIVAIPSTWNEWQRKNVTERVLKTLAPYIKDIDRLNVVPEMAQGERVSAMTMHYSSIQSKYLVGSLIDYDRIWGEIFNVATRLGIRLDAETESKDRDERRVKESRPRKIGEVNGFFYFETVNVLMKDTVGDKAHLLIQIESEIFKRKGYSNRKRIVECRLDAGMSSGLGDSDIGCAEAPFLAAVTRAIQK